MSKSAPKWFVPISDGPTVEITIDDGFNMPAVLLDGSLTGERARVLTPMEAAQLGQALQDAAREAATRDAATRRKR